MSVYTTITFFCLRLIGSDVLRLLYAGLSGVQAEFRLRASGPDAKQAVRAHCTDVLQKWHKQGHTSGAQR